MQNPGQCTIAPFLVVVALGLLAALTFLSPAQAVAASAQQQDAKVVVYFFWGDGCPHCAAAKPFLADLAQRYPNVVVREYEVWHDEKNQVLFSRMAAKFGFEPSAVPTIFIGERDWVGYAPQPTGAQIEAYVAACAASGCAEAGSGVIAPLPTPIAPPIANAAALPENAGGGSAVTTAQATSAADLFTLPLLGTVDLTNRSLAVSTALIAFVDGFNPCSLWVLTLLLALSLRSGSRQRVFLIGLVFIIVTAAVYALFIAGLFTLFTVVSFLGWIQAVAALAALFFALVNIKDYLWYKEGVSFTIADEKKPGIYQAIRRVLNTGDSLWGLVGATVILAAGVSLVEFSCTAGFPVLWTNLLISQNATALGFVLLLLLYILIYQIDELGIFALAVVTLKANRFEESHGRILKLVGGMLMLSLAVVMLTDPALMNGIGASLLVFVAVCSAAGLVLLIHRVVLPRFGVYIGAGFQPGGMGSRLRRQKTRRV